ncbi:hypothetical protein [Psychrobacter ciconiae]|uniref:hypothetical protein n=1 Tax=Psychrobacter ciconiae TaxID=1553449 RepID=UPI001917C915|nr:hypothetical protein [Psychrobacter ciconiae]
MGYFTTKTLGVICALAAILPLTAHAATKVTVAPVASSATIIEQSSDGKVATITATPTGITMQNGAPYYATQVSTSPRYVTKTQNVGVAVTPVVPVATTVVTAPTAANTVITPIATTADNTVISVAQPTAPATSVALKTLEITPTFSTEGVVTANTKIMKVLKDSSGREFAVPANKINAGDVIEYHTNYVNTTPQPVTDLNAKLILPQNIKLISLQSSLPTYAQLGDTYQVIDQNAVVTQSYSGLKWDLVDLAANTPQTVVIRAQVQ